MKKFLTKPMYIFGLFGLIAMLLGLVLGIYLTVIKVFFSASIGSRPMLILSVVLVLAGLQSFSFGVLAELLMRTYHESQNRPIYRVRDVFGDK